MPVWLFAYSCSFRADTFTYFSSTGTVVGVAFATFIIGLVVGAAAFYFLQEQPILRTVRHFFSIRKRRQSYTTDQDTHRDIEMNFKPLEETC